MKRKLVSLIAVLAIVIFGGCYSMSTYQTADTVPEGKFSGGVGFSTLQMDTSSDTDSTAEDVANSFLGGFQMLELFFRYGIADNMDIGFKLYSSNLALDFKWRMLPRESMFRAAINAGAVYTSLIFTSGWGVYVNAILDFTPAKWITIYFGPKYMYTHYNIDFDESSDSDGIFPEHYYGGFIGISLNFGKLSLRPEVSFYKIAFNLNDINTSTDEGYLFQPGIALNFGY